MSRRLRFIPPGGALVEITCRTFQGRYLLKPSPAVNRCILGILGRAQRLYPTEVHAFVFMSNHYHLLVSVPDAQRMAQFVGYLNSNLGRELGRMHGWNGKFWDRRYQAIVVSEEEAAQVARLKYLLSQGVKERLVRRPTDWPGLHAAKILLASNSTITGRWRDRTREYHARGAGNTQVFMCIERLHLTPLPCWRDQTTLWMRQRVQELVDLVCEENSGQIVGDPPNPKPTKRPARIKRSPVPLFHCATKAARKALYEAYSWFVAAYRDACERLKAGHENATFPPGSFPPPRPFVPV